MVKYQLRTIPLRKRVGGLKLEELTGLEALQAPECNKKVSFVASTGASSSSDKRKAAFYCEDPVTSRGLWKWKTTVEKNKKVMDSYANFSYEKKHVWLELDEIDSDEEETGSNSKTEKLVEVKVEKED
nr:hypothetical protein [Tanacetum cinerariifolium]